MGNLLKKVLYSHSIVKYGDHLYSYTNTSIHKMIVDTKSMSLYWNNWSPILTSRYPSKGLRNYGFGIKGYRNKSYKTKKLEDT
jgi:hypothetical protein